ncbi:aromatic prenyltransferase [Thozetella sp. PMI_491]|nr:aromatic prenyltransferase [Thozetella sp. PMI_491]
MARSNASQTAPHPASYTPPFDGIILQVPPKGTTEKEEVDAEATHLPSPASSTEKTESNESDAVKYNLTADQSYWWATCKPAIANLMDYAGSYMVEEKESNLRFLAEHIIPTFGPIRSEAKTMPLLTDDHSPFEPSWNFSSKGKTTVRFTFEPLGPLAGTETDPFVQAIVPQILPSLAREADRCDTRWFNQFVQALFLHSAEEMASVKAGLPSFLPGRAPQSFIAFDLDGKKRGMKAYFFPILKALSTKRSCETVTFDAIRGLEPCGAELTPAVNTLEKYMATSCPEPCPVEMIAIDCVDPSAGARVKVYGRTESNSWDVVKHVYTLGGLANDETTLQGLEILRSVWHLLQGEREPVSDSFHKKPRETHTRHKGICFGFEMVPGRELPEVKVYVPMWNYAPDDQTVAENLAEVFRLQGWGAVADKYGAAVRDSFPRADLRAPAYTHTYLSFAFSKKKGVYMTMYYSASGMSVC